MQRNPEPTEPRAVPSRVREVSKYLQTLLTPFLDALRPLAKINPRSTSRFERELNANGGWTSAWVSVPDWPRSLAEILDALPDAVVRPATSGLLALPECASFLAAIVTSPASNLVNDEGAAHFLLRPLVTNFAARFGLSATEADIVSTCDRAAHHLVTERLHVRYLVPIPGLAITETVELEPGLRLVQIPGDTLDSLATTFSLERDRYFFDLEAGIELEVELSKNEPINRRAERETVALLLTLMRVHLNAPLQQFGWLHELSSPFVNFGGKGFARSDVTNVAQTELDADGISFLRECWPRLRDQKLSDHLALARWNSAMLATHLGDRLVDLWIALENLFGEGGKSELRYRMSLRIPAFVGKSAAERRELVRTIKQSYDLRSALCTAHNTTKHSSQPKPLSSPRLSN
ncbi:MAG: HEPN domain-containing protein [Archangium sp.]